jgi:hypothetical protein
MSEPYSSASDAELSGIGGWLIFVAIGQVLGPLQVVAALFIYQTSVPDGVWGAYPVAMSVELLISLVLLGVVVWTSIRFFGKRRSFPRWFTIEWIIGVAYLPLTLLWAAAATGLPLSNFAEGQDWIQWIVMSGVGFVWVLYIHNSVRVRNTFVE